ncbi:hypothetical protein [Neptunicella sp.]|uniref:hypothetical protein n=1 Tax=Neptunicella sp. TaxID=2125986 RepID=UPI003F68EBF5
MRRTTYIINYLLEHGTTRAEHFLNHFNMARSSLRITIKNINDTGNYKINVDYKGRAIHKLSVVKLNKKTKRHHRKAAPMTIGERQGLKITETNYLKAWQKIATDPVKRLHNPAFWPTTQAA